MWLCACEERRIAKDNGFSNCRHCHAPPGYHPHRRVRLLWTRIATLHSCAPPYSLSISLSSLGMRQVLDFVVTDGVRYDTGPEGLFYHAMVTHVREADKAGNIITYRQEADGTLIKTGVIEKVDPQVCC